MLRLRQALEVKPRYLEEIAGQIFVDEFDSREKLVALVDLAAKARVSEEDQALIPARYHLFVRAIEGAFISLCPSKKLYLERREQITENGRSYVVFEIAACRQCGVSYLVGELQTVDGKSILKQPGKQYFENPENLEFYLLPGTKFDPLPLDEDEEISQERISPNEEEFKLCTSCGAIDQATLLTPLCSCGEENYVSIFHVPSKHGKVHSCPACGATNPGGLVWRFLTGNDATASVLATALYQEIPAKELKPRPENTTMFDTADPWAATERYANTSKHDEQFNTGQRQLLIFSDSRQDAAFFAPYLDRTYSQILRRRIILQALQNERERVLHNRWRVNDLINPLRRSAERIGIWDALSQQQKEAESWKWALHELLALDRRNSLEGLGLLGFSVVFPDDWKPLQGFLNLGFSDEEVRLFYQVLLANFRTKGAILFPDIVSPQDEFFAPRNREYFFIKKRPEGIAGNSYVFGWNPTRQKGMNSRLDYLLRVMRVGFGQEITDEEGNKILSAIWNNDIFPNNQTNPWRGYFSTIPTNDGLIVHRMKPDYWELRPGYLDPSIQWYYCDRCNNLTLYDVRNICSTYECPGALHPCNPQEAYKDNHYRKMYTGGKPMRLVAREHTAQLTSQSAAELQTQFIEGAVNVLSCSTTFELGVDVGELRICIYA